MAKKKVGNPNIGEEGKPYRWEKGQSGNPKGRPLKIYTQIKQMGYSAEDLKAAFGELPWYTSDELRGLMKDKTKPVIAQIVASCLYQALKKGDMRPILQLLEHTLGKPQANVDVTSGGEKLPEFKGFGFLQGIAKKPDEEEGGE